MAPKSCADLHGRHRRWTIAMYIFAIAAAVVAVGGLTIDGELNAPVLSLSRLWYPTSFALALVALMCRHRLGFVRGELERRCRCW